MNKKPIIALFAGISALACAAGLAACGGGHTHGYSDEWSSDSGRHYHECTDEGCNSVADVANHVWDDGTAERPANCYQKGTTKYECTVCRYTKTEENIPTTDHVWGDWEITAENTPTNDKLGKATKSCTNDGCSATDTEEIVLPVLTDDRYKVTDDSATCGGEGTGTYTYADGTRTLTFVAATPAKEHPYALIMEYDQDTHWWKVTCEHTDAKHGETPHVWYDPVIKDKKVQYECKSCGYIKEVTPAPLDIESGNAVTEEGFYAVTVPAGKKYTVSASGFEYAPVTANLLNYQTLAITQVTCPLYGVVAESDGKYYAFNAEGALCAVKDNRMTNLAVDGVKGSAYAAVAECKPLELTEGEYIIRIVKNSGNVLTVFDEMKVGCTLSFSGEDLPQTEGGGTITDPYVLVIGQNYGVTTDKDEYESTYVGSYIKYYTYKAPADGQLTVTAPDGESFAFTSKASFDGCSDGDYVFPGEVETCTVTMLKNETLYIVAGNANGTRGYCFNAEFVSAS